jgi:hypothetical protein
MDATAGESAYTLKIDIWAGRPFDDEGILVSWLFFVDIKKMKRTTGNQT